MYRVHKIKLDPTREQAIYFARACGVARFAFNWALAAWKEEYEAGGKPNEAALRKRLNAIKGEQFPWMAEITKVAPQNAIKNVGLAFQHFFRRVKQGSKPGYRQRETGFGEAGNSRFAQKCADAMKRNGYMRTPLKTHAECAEMLGIKPRSFTTLRDLHDGPKPVQMHRSNGQRVFWYNPIQVRRWYCGLTRKPTAPSI